MVGLGALGSAAAWQLARRGHSVVGLDRFALGHDRGASHDTSRILRHSYHTPGYVELTLEAYADWADLEDASGEPLVTTTGGLDLFPPDPAIVPDDYTASMDAVGIAYDVLDAAEVDPPLAGVPAAAGHDGAAPGGRRDRARRPRARAVMQAQARRHGADLRGESARARARRPRRRRGRGLHGGRHDPRAAAWSSPPTRGPTTCSGTSACTCRSR